MYYYYLDDKEITLNPKFIKNINSNIKTTNLKQFLNYIKKTNIQDLSICKYIIETGEIITLENKEFLTNDDAMYIIETDKQITYIFKSETDYFLISKDKVFKSYFYEQKEYKKVFKITDKIILLRLIKHKVNLYWKGFTGQWKKVEFNKLYTNDTVYGFTIKNHPDRIFEL